MNTNEIVSKLWKLCDVLRDDGVSYQNYVSELASLLFIKMCDELDDKRGLLPEGQRWSDLVNKNGLDQLQFYRRLLVDLGEDNHSIVRAIFANVNTHIDKPKHLQELIAGMDKLDWFDQSRDDFGDMYEGLLEKNAAETKSGAGQYFTPRPLINTMTTLLKPEAGEVVQDPAAGTAGFLIAADRIIKQNTLQLESLLPTQQTFQQRQAFQGIELVSGTRRLALMNCLLHDIEGRENSEGPIKLGNTLSADGEHLVSADVILTNPPFGSAKGAGVSREFTHETNNKQLAFMQHIYTNLKPGGRAAVVIPDNVLFESGVGTRIRTDLMDKCNLHTVLRLPTGIFYAAGVKTNVLFFQKGTQENPQQDKDCTKETWVYDLRTNMQTFGKRSPFTEKHLENFEQAYGEDANGLSPREEGIYHILGCTSEEGIEQIKDNARFRKFSRQAIKDKGDSLDITWLKDNSISDAANLPEPDVLATEAMTELTEALRKMNQLMFELGASDQAEGQVALLAEEFGLEKKIVEGAG